VFAHKPVFTHKRGIGTMVRFWGHAHTAFPCYG
jgi:hypothetical protein